MPRFSSRTDGRNKGQLNVSCVLLRKSRRAKILQAELSLEKRATCGHGFGSQPFEFPCKNLKALFCSQYRNKDTTFTLLNKTACQKHSTPTVFVVFVCMRNLVQQTGVYETCLKGQSLRVTKPSILNPLQVQQSDRQNKRDQVRLTDRRYWFRKVYWETFCPGFFLQRFTNQSAGTCPKVTHTASFTHGVQRTHVY